MLLVGVSCSLPSESFSTARVPEVHAFRVCRTFLDVRLVVLRLHQSWQWEESAPLRLCMPQEAPLHISSTLAKFETKVQSRKDEASMSENEPTSLLRLKSFGFLQIAFLVTELNTRLILIKYIGEAMWILSEATWILLIPQAVYCSFLCTLSILVWQSGW